MDPELRVPELWPAGSIVARDYEIQKRLGAGGFGTVYLARHRYLDSLHVIKRLHEHLASNEDFVRKFMREGRAIRKLQSCPNIISVEHMTHTDDGHLILIMEYLPDGDLSKYIAVKQHLDPAEAIGFALQIAAALSAAHSVGVIHRDVKPENVLLKKLPDGTFLAKVIDFGIAADHRNPQQATSVYRQGSLGYASPEQWVMSGKELDGRCDLYALGVVLYRMLTGRMPFESGEVLQFLGNAQTPPPPPGKFRPGIHPALDSLVLDLLQYSRDHRPASADVVIERLRALHYPPESPPPPDPAAPLKAAIPISASSSGAAAAVQIVSHPAQPEPHQVAAGLETPDSEPAHNSSLGIRAVVGLFILGSLVVAALIVRNVWRTPGQPLQDVTFGKASEFTLLHTLNPKEDELAGDLLALAFSPDGKVLATTNTGAGRLQASGHLRLWDLATGKLSRKVHLNGHTQIVSFNRRGDLLACGFDRHVQLLDAKTLQVLYQSPARGSSISAFSFSHDDSFLATLDWTGWVAILDLSTRQYLPGWSADGSSCLTFSPQGDRLLVGRDLWAIHPARSRLDRFKSNGCPDFTPDGRYLVGVAEEPPAKITFWNAETSLPVRAIPISMQGHTPSLHVRQNKPGSLADQLGQPEWLTTEGFDQLWVFDLANGELKQTVPGFSRSVAFSPDRRLFSFIAKDGTIKVFAQKSGGGR